MTAPTLEEIHSSRQLAGRVGRWHTWPMIRRPTSAEHVARVATIYCELWGIPRGEVLYYILHHDSGELLAGDTPYWAKRYNPDLAKAVNAVEAEGLRRLGVTLPALSEEEFKKAEVELNMGNQYARVPLNGCFVSVMDIARSIHDSVRSMIGDWMIGKHRADKPEELNG